MATANHMSAMSKTHEHIITSPLDYRTLKASAVGVIQKPADETPHKLDGQQQQQRRLLAADVIITRRVLPLTDGKRK